MKGRSLQRSTRLPPSPPVCFIRSKPPRRPRIARRKLRKPEPARLQDLVPDRSKYRATESSSGSRWFRKRTFHDRDRGQDTHREKRPSGTFSLISSEPIRKQQTKAGAECNPSPGDQHDLWNRKPSLGQSHIAPGEKPPLQPMIRIPRGDWPKPPPRFDASVLRVLAKSGRRKSPCFLGIGLFLQPRPKLYHSIFTVSKPRANHVPTSPADRPAEAEA